MAYTPCSLFDAGEQHECEKRIQLANRSTLEKLEDAIGDLAGEAWAKLKGELVDKWESLKHDVVHFDEYVLARLKEETIGRLETAIAAVKDDALAYAQDMVQGAAASIPAIGTAASTAVGAGIEILKGGDPIDVSVYAAYGALPIPGEARSEFGDEIVKTALMFAHRRAISDIVVTVARDEIDQRTDHNSLALMVFDTLVTLLMQVLDVHKEDGTIVRAPLAERTDLGHYESSRRTLPSGIDGEARGKVYARALQQDVYDYTERAAVVETRNAQGYREQSLDTGSPAYVAALARLVSSFEYVAAYHVTEGLATSPEARALFESLPSPAAPKHISTHVLGQIGALGHPKHISTDALGLIGQLPKAFALDRHRQPRHLSARAKEIIAHYRELESKTRGPVEHGDPLNVGKYRALEAAKRRSKHHGR